MMKKQNVRTIALIFCTFTYLLIGAAIFDAMESDNEKNETRTLDDARTEIQVKYNISDEDMEELRVNIIRAKPYSAGPQWKFAGAFYFALSVITTIGYGHSTPRTLTGKIFCIFYSMIGIPLNIVMFQSIGERFNIGITMVLQKIKKCIGSKGEGEGDANGTNIHDSVTQTELTGVACILCSGVLVGGAAAFSHFEGWSFPDAFYYCFITMSTIGFGDFVALQNSSMLALQRKPEYVAFSILYIIFGLTVFAAALNLMVLRLLTMNTEDERKDHLEALAAARLAIRIDGDILKPSTQSTTVSSLDRQAEGVQIEVGDCEDHHIYHPSCLKMQESSINSNGVIPNSFSKKSPGLSWILPDEDNSPSNNTRQEQLCIPSSQVTHTPTTSSNNIADNQEEVAGIETVLVSFPQSKKRCSV